MSLPGRVPLHYPYPYDLKHSAVQHQLPPRDGCYSAVQNKVSCTLPAAPSVTPPWPGDGFESRGTPWVSLPAQNKIFFMAVGF